MFYYSYFSDIHIRLTLIYLEIWLVCLSVCITAKLIGPKFCVGPHVTPGKVYEWSKNVNCNVKFLNIRDFLLKSANFFSSLFFNVYNENMFTIEIENGREAP